MTSTRCRLCGDAIRWIATRYAWVHQLPGHDHGPVPA